MFKITRIPLKLKSFFGPTAKDFRFRHYSYFANLVLAVAIAVGRRNVTNLYRHIETNRHRNRFNNFLNLSHRYDLSRTLAHKAHELLQRLDPKAGEFVELILDDTNKQKRGQVLDNVGWLHDHVANKKIQGHNYLQAVLRFRGFIIPSGVRLYRKKEFCQQYGLEFKKKTVLAADLIRSLIPPPGVKVRVLFDSFYLCAEVVKAVRAKGFRFVSCLKDNRCLYKGARKLKTKSYKRNKFKRSSKQQVCESRGNREVEYTFVDAGWFALKGVGQVHVVFSRKGKGKKILGIVTDDPELTAEEMILGYANRFFIEQYFKDCKQLLGLGQYQNLRLEAAEVHLHLVCFAYALLTHLAIESSEQVKLKKKAAWQTVGRLQIDLRRLIFEDTVDLLEEQDDDRSVFERLRSLLPTAA